MALEPDLVSLALIFCAAALATIVSQLGPRLVLPTVVVEIALGILMGPEVLDSANVDPYIVFLSDFGLVVLFFLAGIEVIHRNVPRRLLAQIASRPERARVGGRRRVLAHRGDLVAVIEVREERGETDSDVAAALVGAGMASVLRSPLLGLLVCRAPYTKQEFAGDEA